MPNVSFAPPARLSHRSGAADDRRSPRTDSLKDLIKLALNRGLQALPFPPERTGARPRGWATARSVADADQGRYFAVHPARRVTRRPPGTSGESLHWKFREHLQEDIAETFVLALTDGRVWGRAGAVITAQNTVVADVSREFAARSPSDHSVFHQLRLKPARRIEGRVAVLSTAGADTYYHWMCDIVPRVHLLQQHYDLRSFDAFVVDVADAPFQLETLERLGIPRERIIVSRDNWAFHISASELVVPSLPSRLNTVAPWTVEFLRRLMGGSGPTGAARRLYLSRADSRGRRVLNEDALATVLRRHGFETVHPERMSVEAQARLFGDAGCVVAPHGSGLTNVVFAPPGAMVVDLFAPGWVNPCFWTAAESAGIDYHYALGMGVRPPEYVDREDKGADVEVDVRALERLLEEKLV